VDEPLDPGARRIGVGRPPDQRGPDAAATEIVDGELQDRSEPFDREVGGDGAEPADPRVER
jgi:hypothetical protein